jgi:3-isopropylmalate dehydrogenase
MSIRKISSRACERVAHAAFKLAEGRRKKVTAVHKANVLKITDGLFLKEVRRVGEQYPGVVLEELIVDATAAMLIRSPERFDVIVTTNMFGDILSDEASELCGSLGLGGSINVGDSICVAQAQHGSAPDIEGQNVANPTSLILSAAMLLRWRGEKDRNTKLIKGAAMIEKAVDAVLADPDLRTRDIGGTRTTDEFAISVVDSMQQRSAVQDHLFSHAGNEPRS